jgi:MFS family permease
VTTPDPRLQMILPATCLGMLALGANGTAIMAALPTMRDELRLSPAQLEWTVNIYLIVSAACIIPGGTAGDKFGARRVAMAGLTLFAIASVVVATAQVPTVLLAGRGLQGLAAALAVPGTLAAISETNSPERRALAIGAWAGFLMLGFSLGPLIGGALTHYVSWHTIFWVSGVVMLIATSGFVFTGFGGARSTTQRIGRFDWAGFALLAIFMSALVSALHAMPTVMTAPSSFMGFGVLAGMAFFALVKIERHAADPLIDLGLFKEPTFLRALGVGSIAMSSILALLLFYNLDAQSPTGLSLTSVGAGLSLLPLSGGLLIFAFSAPTIVRRFGPRRALVGSNSLTAAAGMGIAVAAGAGMSVPLMLGLFAIGVGLALPYATAPRLALSALPATHTGAGSGIINACTFLGGSIGVAGGGVAFVIGGLPAAMGLIVLLSLIGIWLCRGLPTSL